MHKTNQEGLVERVMLAVFIFIAAPVLTVLVLSLEKRSATVAVGPYVEAHQRLSRSGPCDITVVQSLPSGREPVYACYSRSGK